MPSSTAAPASCPLVFSSVRSMWARSASFRVTGSAGTSRFKPDQLIDWRVQHRSPRQYHGALDEVLQLADVARPRVVHQTFHGRAGMVSICLLN